MVGACSMYGIKQRCIYVFGGEVKGRRLFARGGRRWNVNIKMYLKEVGFEGHGLVSLLKIGTGVGLL